MKTTGIVRKVDQLGRIAIPAELRRTFGIEIKDPLAIYTDRDRIILKRYEPACIFCGNLDESIESFHGRMICRECREELQQLVLARMS
ncbi:MAG: AbrB/MazE/SpoVT family DNA-binding domain-containing protein [Alicyclobacillus shizuokensis]|nr:AbrB/MazE/SpoVT family DNA-binding domain-containing protein [Alicyclobacillus shizuokensis]